MKYWTDQGYSAASVRVCPSQEGPMGQLFQVTTTTEFATHTSTKRSNNYMGKWGLGNPVKEATEEDKLQRLGSAPRK